MKVNRKKIATIMLSLLMCMYVIPASAFAADDQSSIAPLEISDEIENLQNNENDSCLTDDCENKDDSASLLNDPKDTEVKEAVPNVYGPSIYSHVDVKVKSEMNVIINGVIHNIKGTMQQKGLKVTIGKAGESGFHTFTNFFVSHNEPGDDVEYRDETSFSRDSIHYFTKSDKPYINNHGQDYSHLFISNVTLDGTILFPVGGNEILEDLLPKTSDGQNYCLELINYPYDFINECCGSRWTGSEWSTNSNGGRKSQDGTNYPAGLDLYITGKDIEKIVLGKAEIRKVGTGLEDGIAYPNPTFTIKDSEGTIVQDNISVNTNGDAILIDNLEPGSYKIEETIEEVAGYSYEVSGTDFVITAGETTPVTVTNTYTQQEIKPEPITVTISAQKELAGKQLENNQFHFNLDTMSGTNISTGTNDVQGNVTFSITFEHSGTASYYLSEVNDDQENITYDDAVYKVLITVNEKNGELIPHIRYFTEDGSPVDKAIFTNTYTTPPEPFAGITKPPLCNFPQTGDNNHLVLCFIMLTLSLGGAVTIALLRKKFS